MGGVGLRGVRLGIGPSRNQPTDARWMEVRVARADGSQQERDRAIQAWLEELFDLAGVPVDEPCTRRLIASFSRNDPFISDRAKYSLIAIKDDFRESHRNRRPAFDPAFGGAAGA